MNTSDITHTATTAIASSLERTGRPEQQERQKIDGKQGELLKSSDGVRCPANPADVPALLRNLPIPTESDKSWKTCTFSGTAALPGNLELTEAGVTLLRQAQAFHASAVVSSHRELRQLIDGRVRDLANSPDADILLIGTNHFTDATLAITLRMAAACKKYGVKTVFLEDSQGSWNERLKLRALFSDFTNRKWADLSIEKNLKDALHFAKQEFYPCAWIQGFIPGLMAALALQQGGLQLHLVDLAEEPGKNNSHTDRDQGMSLAMSKLMPASEKAVWIGGGSHVAGIRAELETLGVQPADGLIIYDDLNSEFPFPSVYDARGFAYEAVAHAKQQAEDAGQHVDIFLLPKDFTAFKPRHYRDRPAPQGTDGNL